MKRIEKIINNKDNIGIDFIVHVQNQSELKDLTDVLEKNNFCMQLSFFGGSLKEQMERFAKKYDYDFCFRIRNREDDKCIACNPSIEHWRMFCNDILEIRNGELVFNEGEYTLDTAKTEAKKIFDELYEDSSWGIYESLFNELGFAKDASEEEIVKGLLNRRNNNEEKF